MSRVDKRIALSCTYQHFPLSFQLDFIPNKDQVIRKERFIDGLKPGRLGR